MALKGAGNLLSWWTTKYVFAGSCTQSWSLRIMILDVFGMQW